MRNHLIIKLQFLILVAIFLTSGSSCSLDQSNALTDSALKVISQRTDCTNCAQAVINKVSEIDHIPVEQILTCNYYSTTTEGYCEYRLTTQFNGPRVFYVTAIIGDEVEGW